MCLIRALRDCKQRSLTVSKKAPTVSRKASRFVPIPLLPASFCGRAKQGELGCEFVVPLQGLTRFRLCLPKNLRTMCSQNLAKGFGPDLVLIQCLGRSGDNSREWLWRQDVDMHRYCPGSKTCAHGSSNFILSRFLGRGCDEALFSAKKGFFSEEGGGNSVNGGLGKDFYRKGKFSEEVLAIQ